ncbi:MAG: transcription termination/antitermination factor NusG [Candidatus Omnitrophica bacterium]|nr:transcription termination/antitermination factor NusG [Candidatus Omnitrophota bacterium]
MAKKWYVVHTLTGQEDKVRSNIEKKIGQGEIRELIGQVLVPTEKVSEVKDGKKRISQRKFFPGYVLVEMELNEQSWYFIRNVPGVTGFISSGSKPVPLQDEEILNILKQTEEKKEKPTPKVVFEKGEPVKVIEGPFTNFNGTVEEVNPNKGRLKVSVAIFGRTTPVELEYWQVEKI